MKAEMSPMLKADSHGAQNTSKIRDLACTPVKNLNLTQGQGWGFNEAVNPKSYPRVGFYFEAKLAEASSSFSLPTPFLLPQPGHCFRWGGGEGLNLDPRVGGIEFSRARTCPLYGASILTTGSGLSLAPSRIRPQRGSVPVRPHYQSRSSRLLLS